MDRKHATTCSQQPNSELRDFKLFNTVSFKRTEPKEMKNTGIFSKDKTGKLGLGLGWAQKKNNKQPVFTETNFFDKRAKSKEFQPKNIRQYVENR